jgi:iron complex outermembrane receptor protein
LLWAPHEHHSIWTSVSRAVRTPSRAEDDVRINQQPGPAPGTIAAIFGDSSFESEELIAYELGYRVQPHEKVSLDFATFYNDYDNLRGIPVGTPFPESTPPPAHLVIPLRVDNVLKGETYGAELAANWQMLDWWRWSGSYTYLQMQIHQDSNTPNQTTERSIEGSSPHHQFSIRSKMDLPNRVQLDAMIRYVDVLPAIRVESYIAMDLRIGWNPTENLELSLVGQNLFDKQHLEYRPSSIATQTTEIERGVYGKVTWRF